jgi:malonate decarboxylase holo-[acyl-carrier-protein] synthase
MLYRSSKKSAYSVKSADRSLGSGDQEEYMVWSTHDLLQISEMADVVCVGGEQFPLWAKVSLEIAPFVVVRRANPIRGMIPIGIRGLWRNQRFAGYLVPDSVLKRVTPEQLTESHSSRGNAQRESIPALNTWAEMQVELSNFSLAYGPTGSVGFELASGLSTATAASDLDLLIRTPERLSMESARKLMAIFSQSACRLDVQLETPGGAVCLAEYASGQRPLLLRQNGGPVLIDDPWAALRE